MKHGLDEKNEVELEKYLILKRPQRYADSTPW